MIIFFEESRIKILAIFALAMLSLMPCTSVLGDDTTVDISSLEEAEANVVKYFRETPNGKCSWHSSLQRPNGDPIFEMNYDVAFHENQISWHEQPVQRKASEVGMSQFIILNEKHRMHWIPSLETAALQLRPLPCFNGNPMLGFVMHPRYIGTGLEGVIGGLIEKSPRGIFADGGLERIAAENTTLDGQPVLKGKYKWGVWDVVMYYSTSQPTVLLKTVTSALSDTGIHTKTVALTYEDWDCGVRYPGKVVYEQRISDKPTHREVLTVNDFDVLSETEVKERFTMAAMNFPDDRNVLIYDDSCENVNRFHKVDGELIPWTQKEIDDYMRSLRFVESPNTNTEKTQSETLNAKSPWPLYGVALALLASCMIAFVRLTRQATIV